MNKFMKWLNESFAPKMQKINNNPWILTIKESIMQVMPLIFLGSIFCILTIPGDYISWWAELLDHLILDIRYGIHFCGIFEFRLT